MCPKKDSFQLLMQQSKKHFFFQRIRDGGAEFEAESTRVGIIVALQHLRMEERSRYEARGEGTLPLLDKLRLRGRTATACGTCQNTAPCLRCISAQRCLRTWQTTAFPNQYPDEWEGGLRADAVQRFHLNEAAGRGEPWRLGQFKYMLTYLYVFFFLKAKIKTRLIQ